MAFCVSPVVAIPAGGKSRRVEIEGQRSSLKQGVLSVAQGDTHWLSFGKSLVPTSLAEMTCRRCGAGGGGAGSGQEEGRIDVGSPFSDFALAMFCHSPGILGTVTVYQCNPLGFTAP